MKTVRLRIERGTTHDEADLRRIEYLRGNSGAIQSKAKQRGGRLLAGCDEAGQMPCFKSARSRRNVGGATAITPFGSFALSFATVFAELCARNFCCK